MHRRRKYRRSSVSALSDTSESSADVQVLAQLDIPASGVSFAGARRNNSYNRVTIGSN